MASDFNFLCGNNFRFIGELQIQRVPIVHNILYCFSCFTLLRDFPCDVGDHSPPRDPPQPVLVSPSPLPSTDLWMDMYPLAGYESKEASWVSLSWRTKSLFFLWAWLCRDVFLEQLLHLATQDQLQEEPTGDGGHPSTQLEGTECMTLPLALWDSTVFCYIQTIPTIHHIVRNSL